MIIVLVDGLNFVIHFILEIIEFPVESINRLNLFIIIIKLTYFRISTRSTIYAGCNSSFWVSDFCGDALIGLNSSLPFGIESS